MLWAVGALEIKKVEHQWSND